MAAVTDQFLASNIHTAEVTLANRGFIRTTPKRVTPSQWMNGAHHWATIEVMPSGKAAKCLKIDGDEFTFQYLQGWSKFVLSRNAIISMMPEQVA